MRIQSFIGQARTSIDSKGRTAFPREFRKFLTEEDGAEIVIGPGPQQSLILFTVKEWNQFMEELKARPRTQANDRFIQQISSWSHVCELDGQNRISIPPTLQKYATLTSEVIFAARGGGKTALLWNPERFESINGLSTTDAQKEFDSAFWADPRQEVPR
jgi:division/cell wall cluster transcriptional repressor MraZ